MTITFTIPLKTKNTSNAREPIRARIARLKRERDTAMVLCPKWNGGPLLSVTLTRVGPREMDDDGLRSALKAVRDGVAARLRIDDGSPLVRWDYAQEKGEPGVRVSIEKAEDAVYWVGRRGELRTPESRAAMDSIVRAVAAKLKHEQPRLEVHAPRTCHRNHYGLEGRPEDEGREAPDSSPSSSPRKVRP